MKDEELETLRQNPEIIRNQLKIYGARKNAQASLQIRQEFASFDCYVWGFVKGKPITNHWPRLQDAPTTTPGK